MRLTQTLHAPVIGNNKAGKAPIVTQNIGQQPFIRAAGQAVPAVVRRHHRLRARVEAGLERRQNRFAHGALACFAVVGITPAEAVVISKMLGRGNHAVLFQTAAHGHAHIAGEFYVFAEGFDCAAPAAVARKVDHRREHLPHADRGTLFADGVSNLLHKRGIEHGRERDRLRKICAHAPLRAVQRFAVFDRRNMMRLRVDAALHVGVDLCGHLSR